MSDVFSSSPPLGAGAQVASIERRSAGRGAPTYAALDLGTNNCRLLIARPTADGFRVVDAFSRIVRLGEGLSLTGRLSEAAIERTLAALRICRDKMAARAVTRARTIATEACRSAANGAAFVDRVREELGVTLEIVDRETEAHLAAAGVGDLADRDAEVDRDVRYWRRVVGNHLARRRRGLTSTPRAGLGIDAAWRGVARRTFGGVDVTDRTFAAMTAYVSAALRPFVDKVADETRCDRFHLLGTSGTVTTIAGVHLNLPRYDRRAVDGLWLDRSDVDAAVARLRSMSYAERAANACIGQDRADLVLAGCAILQAIRTQFPAERLRIADRGLREGILAS